MLFELVLVAAVLALVGLAVYQAGHRGNVASTPGRQAPATADGLAASAAASATEEANADAALSATAESTTADELSATDTDVSNLGGTSANAF
jgi:hypothetical protein